MEYRRALLLGFLCWIPAGSWAPVVTSGRGGTVNKHASRHAHTVLSLIIA